MTNPFEQIADRQIVSPRKARMRVAEKRLQKRRTEQDIFFRLWKERHDKMTQELPDDVKKLLQFLLRLDQAGELVEHLEAWLKERKVTADEKHRVLQIVDRAIIYHREKEGLPPFDDALPGEDDTAFLIIRKMLS